MVLEATIIWYGLLLASTNPSLASITLNGVETETSLPLDGTVSKMQPTSFAKLRPNRTLKTLLASWLMQEEGKLILVPQ